MGRRGGKQAGAGQGLECQRRRFGLGSIGHREKRLFCFLFFLILSLGLVKLIQSDHMCISFLL